MELRVRELLNNASRNFSMKNMVENPRSEVLNKG